MVIVCGDASGSSASSAARAALRVCCLKLVISSLFSASEILKRHLYFLLNDGT